MELISIYRFKTKEIVCRGTYEVRHIAKRIKFNVLWYTNTVFCPKCDREFNVSSGAVRT